MSDSRPFSRSFLVKLVLVLLLVGSVVFAITAEKPWGKTVSRRVEKQQELQPKEYAVIGLWWGAVVDGAVLAVLLGSAKWWVPRRQESTANGQGPTEADRNTEHGAERSETDSPRLPGGRGGHAESKRKTFVASTIGILVLLGILILAAWLRAPRLDHSLWNDEEYAMRRFALGEWDSEMGFVPASWTETLFENRNGNNHLLNSLITRESLVVWRAFTHAPESAFNETALRMPAFIAGLLTIAMIYLLGCRVSTGKAASRILVGFGAAALLALCPWHIRYSVEAKGYSFMLLFVCTAIYGLIRAIDEDRLRWWLLFAFSEAAFLLSFAGSIYVAATLNVFAALSFVKQRAWRNLWALIAFNLLAMLPVLPWMLPSIPQLLRYLHSEGSLHLDLGWPWLRDFFGGLALGFQYENLMPADHAGTSWVLETAVHPWIAPLMWLASAFLVAGIVCACFQNTAARLAIVAPVIAVTAAYAHNAIAGTPMVVWYLLYVIVPGSLAVPLALIKLVRTVQSAVLRLRKRSVEKDEYGESIDPPPWPAVAPLLMFCLLFAYATATSGAVQRLRFQPRQPMREAVAFAHAADKPEVPERRVVTGVLGVSDRQIQSYDSTVFVLDDRKELAGLVEEARKESRPLTVYVCGESFIRLGADGKLRAKQPVLEALLNGLPAEEAGGKPASFSEVARFYGTEAMFTYHVYRLNL